ncbi:MAG: hypothetical protein PHE83_16770 [Opitutaceae bacterium]|nr:hypothetical protein [Opitutaceae bacterium]
MAEGLEAKAGGFGLPEGYGLPESGLQSQPLDGVLEGADAVPVSGPGAGDEQGIGDFVVAETGAIPKILEADQRREAAEAAQAYGVFGHRYQDRVHDPPLDRGQPAGGFMNLPPGRVSRSQRRRQETQPCLAGAVGEPSAAQAGGSRLVLCLARKEAPTRALQEYLIPLLGLRPAAEQLLAQVHEGGGDPVGSAVTLDASERPLGVKTTDALQERDEARAVCRGDRVLDCLAGEHVGPS